MKKTMRFLLTSLVAVFASAAFSQSTVTGTVLDGDMNAPLPGANIVEKDTKNGVSSDFDGNFSISTEASSGEVVVSYVGYASQTIAFSGNQDLGTIVLQADNTLEEVVVTSGIIDVAKERETP